MARPRTPPGPYSSKSSLHATADVDPLAPQSDLTYLSKFPLDIKLQVLRDLLPTLAGLYVPIGSGPTHEAQVNKVRNGVYSLANIGPDVHYWHSILKTKPWHALLFVDKAPLRIVTLPNQALDSTQELTIFWLPLSAAHSSPQTHYSEAELSLLMQELSVYLQKASAIHTLSIVHMQRDDSFLTSLVTGLPLAHLLPRLRKFSIIGGHMDVDHFLSTSHSSRLEHLCLQDVSIDYPDVTRSHGGGNMSRLRHLQLVDVKSHHHLVSRIHSSSSSLVLEIYNFHHQWSLTGTRIAIPRQWASLHHLTLGILYTSPFQRPLTEEHALKKVVWKLPRKLRSLTLLIDGKTCWEDWFALSQLLKPKDQNRRRINVEDIAMAFFLANEDIMGPSGSFKKLTVIATPLRTNVPGLEEAAENTKNRIESFCGEREVECDFIECEDLTVYVGQQLTHSFHPMWLPEDDE
ncbi:unnamed protein product [Somion occarium]|uniref:F-box domain-containing protein n=1 Tax=Somion occarium TaxID=3059160 RepID=A0ABP1DJM3_9APHY